MPHRALALGWGRLLSTAIALLLTMSGMAWAEDAPASAPVATTEAEAHLKRMAELLSSTQAFVFEAEVSYDVVQASGQRLQFSATRNAFLSRSGGLHGVLARDDGANAKVWLAHGQLALWNEDANVFGTTAVPAAPDEALDYVADVLGVPVPLADFFYTDPYAALMADVESGLYVGEHRIGGVWCHHLAFRTPQVDWEIWIDAGEVPVPRKFVVTYKRRQGHPQFTARMSEWDLSPVFIDNLFLFQPPADAGQIAIIPLLQSRGAALQAAPQESEEK